MDELVTRNIFIDSSIYIGKNFDFNGKILMKVKELAKDEFINVIMTDIVKYEVQNKILENVEESRNSLKSLRNKGKILRNFKEYEAVFKVNLIDLVGGKITNNFTEFIKDAKVEFISLNQASLEDIIQAYFNTTAPFNEKKKHEFPDAINLFALEAWCKSNKSKMYIISSDGDLKNFCLDNAYLFHLGSIEEFLNLITATDEYQYSFVSSLFEKNYSEIENHIIANFEVLGFQLDNEIGEVENINITEIEIEDDPNIIELDGGTATLSFEARIYFEADVSILDAESSYYDHEEGKYLIENYDEINIEDDILVPVLLTISYDFNNINRITINQCEVNEDKNIDIHIYDSDRY